MQFAVHIKDLDRDRSITPDYLGIIEALDEDDLMEKVEVILKDQNLRYDSLSWREVERGMITIEDDGGEMLMIFAQRA